MFSPVAPLNSWAQIGLGSSPFNGGVFAVAVNGADIYVGGDFTDLNGIPEADGVAKWNGSQWSALGGNGSGNGALLAPTVYALEYFGGNLYVGGSFSAFDASNVHIFTNLAKYDGTWSTVGVITTLNGWVTDLAVYDSLAGDDMLYVGGWFTDANSIATADYAARYNITTEAWSNLDDNGSGDGSLGGGVEALTVDPATGKLYVGGFFTDADGILTADRFATWDGSAWSALVLSGSSNGAFISGFVADILFVSASEIYAGGSFTSVNNNGTAVPEARYITKWNGTSWTALGNAGAGISALKNAGGTSAVRSMILSSGTLYAAGLFAMSDPALASGKYLAKFDGANWSSVDNDGAGGTVFQTSSDGLNSIALSGSTLYVGGNFLKINDSGVELNNAGSFSGYNTCTGAWSGYGNGAGLFNAEVNAVAVIGTDIYVGGNFSDLGNDPRIDYVARWDGVKWNPVGNETEVYGAINGALYALAVDGTNLYAGGAIISVINEGSALVDNAERIAKWNGTDWSALGYGATATDPALNNSVNAIVIVGDDVYAGGAFTDVNNQGTALAKADYIARWNKTDGQWHALAGGMINGALTNTVRALASDGKNIYVGGAFANILSPTNSLIPMASYLARWNIAGDAWSAVPGVVIAFDNDVLALAFANNTLYAGGMFTGVSGIGNTAFLAAWDKPTGVWYALGSGNPINNFVDVIAVDGENIYVGGTFTNAGSLPMADYMARWNGVSWSNLGRNGSGNGALNNTVNALHVYQGDVWVGGLFTDVTNTAIILHDADYVAAYGVTPTPPSVESVTLASPNPTSAASLDFTVKFFESVTGVDASDFSVVASGVNASITNVTGWDMTYTVTITRDPGYGTARIDVLNDGSIKDLAQNQLANGFTAGKAYDLLVIKGVSSVTANDGWMLESSKFSNTASTKNNASTLRVGDDARNRQYRSLLSFDTSGLPDKAIVSKAALKIYKSNVTGTDPFTTHGDLVADIKKGFFGLDKLELGDFNAAAEPINTAGRFKDIGSGWYQLTLSSVSFKYINVFSATQFRIRFVLDDNNNKTADIALFDSGGDANPPQLIVEYSVP